MKIHPVGAELLHVDGQTDMAKITVAFPQFCERAKSAIVTRLRAGRMDGLHLSVGAKASRHAVSTDPFREEVWRIKMAAQNVLGR